MDIKVFFLSTLFFFAVSTTVYSEPIDPLFLNKTVTGLNSDERLFLADNSFGSPTVTGDRDEKAQKDYSFSMGENWRGVFSSTLRGPSWACLILAGMVYTAPCSRGVTGAAWR